MERTASIGTLQRLELEQHKMAKQEWRDEVADWQSMIKAVASVNRDDERVESDHRAAHKRWQMHIWALRDELEVERASFNPDSAASLLEVFTPPDHPDAMAGHPGCGDPAFSPRNPELEPAVDDSDHEDDLSAWEAEGRRGRSSISASEDITDVTEVALVFAHPEFGGSGLGAPPVSAPAFPQSVWESPAAADGFVHPEFGGSAAAVARAPPSGFSAHPEFGGTLPSTPETPQRPVKVEVKEEVAESCGGGGYFHPDFSRRR